MSEKNTGRSEVVDRGICLPLENFLSSFFGSKKGKALTE